MKILSGNETTGQEKLAATIGFFDGLHLGHRHLIAQVKAEAKKKNEASAVITFRQHPRKTVLPGFIPQLLTTFEERISLLAETGIDYCIVLDFTDEMSQISARSFIEHILAKKLQVNTLVIGYDHRFGKNRAEGFDEYKEYGALFGLDVVRAEVFQTDNTNVSSSAIRLSLETGDVKRAATFLARPYSLSGIVTEGARLGRKIGYPTANIAPDDSEKIIPAAGVYAVYVLHQNKKYGGMLNIGVRPTVSDENKISIEVNIFDFNQTIYGEKIEIQFVEKIRNEQKMNGLDELIAQLSKDKSRVQKLL